MKLDDELFELAKRPGGTTCPTCHDHVQVYPRKFNCGMARSLVLLYKLSGVEQQWVKMLSEAVDDGFVSAEHSKLVWWDLAEKHPNKAKDGNSNGLYRITQEGIDFVEGYTTVTSHAREYMSEVLWFEGEQIDIVEALGYDNKFNYDELMRAETPDET